MKVLLEKTDKETIKYAKEIAEKADARKYWKWIVLRIRDNGIRPYEDDDKIIKNLKEFNRLVKKNLIPIEDRDISQYKSIGNIVAYIKEFSGLKSQNEKINVSIQDGAKNLYEDTDAHLIKISNGEAASKYLRHTEWCIKDPKWFYEYTPAEFYLYCSKKNKEDYPLYLYHLGSQQIKDVHDQEIHGDERNKAINLFAQKTSIFEDALKKDISFFFKFEDFLQIRFENVVKKFLYKNKKYALKLCNDLQKKYINLIVEAIEENQSEYLNLTSDKNIVSLYTDKIKEKLEENVYYYSKIPYLLLNKDVEISKIAFQKDHKLYFEFPLSIRSQKRSWAEEVVKEFKGEAYNYIPSDFIDLKEQVAEDYFSYSDISRYKEMPDTIKLKHSDWAKYIFKEEKNAGDFKVSYFIPKSIRTKTMEKHLGGEEIK